MTGFIYNKKINKLPSTQVVLILILIVLTTILELVVLTTIYFSCYQTANIWEFLCTNPWKTKINLCCI